MLCSSYLPGWERADGRVTHLSGLQAEGVELPERPRVALSHPASPPLIAVWGFSVHSTPQEGRQGRNPISQRRKLK